MKHSGKPHITTPLNTNELKQLKPFEFDVTKIDFSSNESSSLISSNKIADISFDRLKQLKLEDKLYEAFLSEFRQWRVIGDETIEARI